MLTRLVILVPTVLGLIVLSAVAVSYDDHIDPGLVIPMALLGLTAIGVIFSGIHATRQHTEKSQQLEREVVVRKEMEKNFFVALEGAEKANEAKSNFLANVSHELRTPMTAIVASTDLLLSMADDPRQREFLGIVRDASAAMTMLINNLLDLSRGEMGRLQLDISPFDLREAISASVAPFVSRAEDRGLRIIMNVDPAVPEVLVGDAPRLRQILHNLLDNAVKFSRRGDIRIDIIDADKIVGEGNVHLQFCVSDEGIGIPPELRDAIFDPFTQADPSSTREFGGTGLGLAICRRLVEMMEGQIAVESAVGVGTTVQFEINLAVGATVFDA